MSLWSRLRNRKAQPGAAAQRHPSHDTRQDEEPFRNSALSGSNNTSPRNHTLSGVAKMSNELVTPENLSQELLTSFDDDGDLRVTDGGVRCFVMPKDGRIRLLSLFGSKAGECTSELLEFANRVNDEYIMVRVSIGSNGAIMFDYDILVKGGVTKQAIVLATKRFLSIPVPAIQEHGRHLVK